MNILIIEDERPAAERLKRLLKDLLPGTFFHGPLDTVKSSVRWLEDNPPPDLIFLDIQLADGLSFEIFRQREIMTPVIFCTAYDQYAIQAFKLNSIDYLLKPIDPAELEKAVRKFSRLKEVQPPVIDFEYLQKAISKPERTYKSRFITKIGDQLKPVGVEEITVFYSADKATYMQLSNGKSYLLDYSLDQIEGLVDPSLFFRINRKYIVAVNSIDDIRTYSSSRLKVNLKGINDNDILVSRERVNTFKEWLDR
ncbi:MAG: LytR/AlgR family response regulator transcription factor [Owenweeksia sp.]